jgi:hypothetical protein
VELLAPARQTPDAMRFLHVGHSADILALLSQLSGGLGGFSALLVLCREYFTPVPSSRRDSITSPSNSRTLDGLW